MSRIFTVISMALAMTVAASAQETAIEELPADSNAEQTATEEGGIDILETINHHISDSHHWNVFSWDGGKSSIDIPLPVMAYNKQNGDFLFALSSSLEEGNSVEKNGVVYTLNHHGKIETDGKEGAVFDFSLTRNVCSGLMCGLLLLLIFGSAAKSMKKNGGVPKGGAVIAEQLVLFVKDIADEQIGKEKAHKYTPYLLSLFFFIWINNIVGLVPFFPGSSNLSGNIAFTGILAIFTFFITQFSGNKHYWLETFTQPEVPGVMKLIMVPLEIVTMFTRPFTLLIRLFANITGGHIIVLSIFSMIFLLQTAAMGFVSVPLAFMIFCLELIFGALQAYIFTVLTALYIGLAANSGKE